MVKLSDVEYECILIDEKRRVNEIVQLRAELAEAKAQYTAACTKLAEAQKADVPENDGTDFAHPAWWRGQEAGDRYRLAAVVTELSLLLGVEIATEALPKRWEELKQMLADARKDSERYQYVRDVAFQHANVSLSGNDDDGTAFVIFEPKIYLPDLPGELKYEEEDWDSAKIDAAIDAARGAK